MRFGLVLLMAVALAGCRPGGPEEEPVGQARVDQLHADCVGRGGEFLRQGKANLFYCAERPKDAGKYCTAAGQCESACLARSHSCAPAKPLFGCNQVLNGAGLEVTQCLE